MHMCNARVQECRWLEQSAQRWTCVWSDQAGGGGNQTLKVCTRIMASPGECNSEQSGAILWSDQKGVQDIRVQWVRVPVCTREWRHVMSWIYVQGRDIF